MSRPVVHRVLVARLMIPARLASSICRAEEVEPGATKVA
jgi:hypothetical protein